MHTPFFLHGSLFFYSEEKMIRNAYAYTSVGSTAYSYSLFPLRITSPPHQEYNIMLLYFHLYMRTYPFNKPVFIRVVKVFIVIIIFRKKKTLHTAALLNADAACRSLTRVACVSQPAWHIIMHIIHSHIFLTVVSMY